MMNLRNSSRCCSKQVLLRAYSPRTVSRFRALLAMLNSVSTRSRNAQAERSHQILMLQKCKNPLGDLGGVSNRNDESGDAVRYDLRETSIVANDVRLSNGHR